MNLTGKPPFGIKADEPPRDPSYMGMVKQLPCVICGAPPPSDAHHCTHRPWVGEDSPYTQEPSAARRSGDRDTIPLCKRHHQDGPEAIHNGKASWRKKHGPDFGYIRQTRDFVLGILKGER